MGVVETSLVGDEHTVHMQYDPYWKIPKHILPEVRDEGVWTWKGRVDHLPSCQGPHGRLTHFL